MVANTVPSLKVLLTLRMLFQEIIVDSFEISIGSRGREVLLDGFGDGSR